MANYRTCKNCKKEKSPCDRREEVRRSIVGLKINSISFRCPERDPLYVCGQRVKATWTVNESEAPGYYDVNDHTWSATIISESGTGYHIVVDDVESNLGMSAKAWFKNQNLHARIPAARLSSLDQPARKICRYCRQPFQENESLPTCETDKCYAKEDMAKGKSPFLTPPGPCASSPTPVTPRRQGYAVNGDDHDRV